MDRLPALINAAVVQYGAGRHAASLGILRRLLALDPANISALHLSGACAAVVEDHETAVRVIHWATVAAGHRAEATLANLAVALLNRATALGRGRDTAAALAACARALVIRPGYPDALVTQATILSHAGRTDQAAVVLRRAAVLEPERVEAWQALGDLLVALHRHADAVDAVRHAMLFAPDNTRLHVLLSCAGFVLGDHKMAERAGLRALALEPGHAAASNLAVIRMQQGRLAAAFALARLSVVLQPDVAEAWVNFGSVWLHGGRPDESTRITRRALRLRPVYAHAHSNILMALEFLDLPPLELLAEHRRFDALHGRPRTAHHRRHDNDADPNRPLRVGYVSSDFRQHVASCFFEPLLAAHDPARVQAFCYSDTARPDSVTRRLIALAAGWRECVGVGEADLAERIRADGIDILVDLTGHSAGNRQAVFARRPAPVQVTWLGYPDSSGLSAMDYRMVDAVTDPEGPADALASEALVRLPGGFLCYWPPRGAPEPQPPPAGGGRPVTFGSFNKLAKVTPAVIAAWADILRRVPGSRLLLKSLGLADEAVRLHVEAGFTRHGVAPERLDLISWSPTWLGHLALYDRIDIALDPFPYNGTTTTCEALWMGVPVVTWLGNRHAARVGGSLLARVGLSDLVADDVGSYTDIAVALAGDPVRLSTLRAGLRDRMRASPLCDAAGFAHRMEEAYRLLWRRWYDARREEALAT